MGVLFQFYLWDQSHVNIVWNTRETGDRYTQSSARNENSKTIKKLFYESTFKCQSASELLNKYT